MQYKITARLSGDLAELRDAVQLAASQHADTVAFLAAANTALDRGLCRGYVWQDQGDGTSLRRPTSAIADGWTADVLATPIFGGKRGSK